MSDDNTKGTIDNSHIDKDAELATITALSDKIGDMCREKNVMAIVLIAGQGSARASMRLETDWACLKAEGDDALIMQANRADYGSSAEFIHAVGGTVGSVVALQKMASNCGHNLDELLQAIATSLRLKPGGAFETLLRKTGTDRSADFKVNLGKEEPPPTDLPNPDGIPFS